MKKLLTFLFIILFSIPMFSQTSINFGMFIEPESLKYEPDFPIDFSHFQLGLIHSEKYFMLGGGVLLNTGYETKGQNFYYIAPALKLPLDEWGMGNLFIRYKYMLGYKNNEGITHDAILLGLQMRLIGAAEIQLGMSNTASAFLFGINFTLTPWDW